MRRTKVVLLRHASRSATEPGDSALNAAGRRQAEELARLVARAELPPPTELWCSPKRRARETLSPLAEICGLPVQVDARIDERRHGESAREFTNRTRALLDACTAAPTAGCLYICTHLDWLETALIVVPSDLSELETERSWATGEFKIFAVEDGFWHHKGGGRASDGA